MLKKLLKPNVFTDFHHAGLLNSLILLFEGRLGGSVYRPIGMEWAEQGFWAVYDHPATQQQYLTLSQGYTPVDGSRPLNRIKNAQSGIYYCQDIDSGKYNKAITLKKFIEMDIDYVIASLPAHIQPFQKLIELHKPNAKLIFQVGNQWTMQAFNGGDAIQSIVDGTPITRVDNVMASAKIRDVPEDVNYVEYHQEFNTNIFKPLPDFDNKTITSLMNCPADFPDYNLLLELEHQMPDWKFNIFGGMGRDGAKHGTKEVAQAIQRSQFIWHVKAGGDGYGHILFNAYACGTPAIVKKSYYTDKLGEKLLIDGETCIDIDNLGSGDIIAKINHYSTVENYNQMRTKAYQNFREQVDFDRDADNVAEFLERLK